MSLQGNLTLEILSKAERAGYGILAQTWYVSLRIRTSITDYDIQL